MVFDASMMTGSGTGETTAALVRRAQDLRDLAIPQRLGESASIQELRIFASAVSDWLERARDLEVPVDSGEAGLEQAAQEIETELSRTRPNHFTAQGAEIVHSPTGIGIVVRPSVAAGEENPTSYNGWMFPITLTKTGGTAVTDDSTQADWTYTIVDTLTEEELGTAVDPTAGDHQWVRPTVGYMTEATFGMAYYDSDGDYVIGWINEVADGAACE